MKHLLFPVLAAVMASALAGCVAELDDPDEATATSAVTVGDFNYVQSYILYLRTDDYPTAPVNGQMGCGFRTYVDAMNWTTRMAHLPNMGGWALADGSLGPNLSVTRPGCI